MSVLVRPLTRSDEAQWRRLWRDYLAFYETEVPEEVYATYFERLLGNDPNDYIGLIAEVDGQPVGLTSNALIKMGVPASWSEQRELFARF